MLETVQLGKGISRELIIEQLRNRNNTIKKTEEHRQPFKRDYGMEKNIDKTETKESALGSETGDGREHHEIKKWKTLKKPGNEN